MNKAVIGLGIVIAGILIVYSSGVLADPFWKEKFTLEDVEGYWTIWVNVKYKEPTVFGIYWEAIKIKQFPINSILYGGKEIEQLQCQIYLTITDAPSTSFQVDTSDFEAIFINGDSVTYHPSLDVGSGSTDNAILVLEKNFYEDDFGSFTSSSFLFGGGDCKCSNGVVSGEYCLKIKPGNDWISIPSPALVNFELEIV
jgi:hypothetical protein